MKRASSWILALGLLGCLCFELHHYTSRRNQYRLSLSQSVSKNFISAPRGVQRKIPLPDGTIVWLNASSTLCYPSNFATGERVLELVGEAYFVVAPISERPLRIQARDVRVDVIGTRFDLRSYPEEASYRTFVTSGSVRVSYNDQAVLVKAGEEATVVPGQIQGQPLSVRQNLDTTEAASWTKGLLTINYADLPGLLRELSRAYNVDIRLEGDVAGKRFKGIVSLKDSLEEVVQRFVGPYAHVQVLRLSQQRMVVTVKS